MPIRALQADKDKFARALPASARMEAGAVFLPKYAPWLGDLETELLRFTASKNDRDDQVDTLAYAALQLPAETEIPMVTQNFVR